MTQKLAPYTGYVDSVAGWVGRVPAHWPVLPNRTLFREIIDRNHPAEPMLSVTIGRGVVLQADLLAGSSKKDSSNEDKANYKCVQPQDIAYNKMRAWQGAVGVSKYRGIVSGAYIVVRLRQPANPEYFHYLFRTPAFAKEAERWSYGITSDQWSLRPNDFKQIYCPLPSRAEQDAIVRFLNYHEVLITRLIRAKRRLIALLTEQKQAIIHRVVTRGLDPSVPLKPSGVDWLGDVPQHWTLKRFKFIGQITSGQVDPRHEPYRDYILIAPNHIESKTGRILLEETAAVQGADSGKYLVKEGQVIYSKIRPNLMKATIARTDCLCSADMYAISPKTTEIRAEYLLFLLLSEPFTRYTVDCSMRVAMPKVNREALGDAWLWYPDPPEQERILGWLSLELRPLTEAIARAQREIDLIREYRTRLIADVVTGKLDVRGVTLPPLDEDRDLAPLDDLGDVEDLDAEDLEPVEETADVAD